MNLANRAKATRATFSKYRGKDFNWRSATCAHVLRFHLRQMGHRPPKMPSFRSAVGARRALKDMGAADLTELLRSLDLVEIAPARMIVGDIAILPGDGEPFDAIVINVGDKFMGWHPDASGLQAMIVQPQAIKAAFRA